MKKITLSLIFSLTFLVSSCGGFFSDDGSEKTNGIHLTIANSGKTDEILNHPKALHSTFAKNVVSSLYYQNTLNGDIFRIFNEGDVKDITEKLIYSFEKANESEVVYFEYYGLSGRATKGVTFIDADGIWNWNFQKVNADQAGDGWKIFTGKYFKYKVISTIVEGNITKKNWVRTNESLMPETIEGIAGIIMKKREKASSGNESSIGPKQERQKAQDANKRLRFLKKLLNGGYITKDDYREQKERILNRL